MDLRAKKYSDQKKNELIIESGKYTVRLASNRQEIEEALRLRFYVFNIELGEGLQESYKSEMDEDIYDKYCDHLIVIETKSSKIVGTYRLQDSESAASGEGFYTMNEFDISEFPEFILNDAFELGRACIDRDHRNGRVLYLLWRGLAKYMLATNKRYLFGCCSITSQDKSEGQAFYKHLRENGFMHPDYLVAVKPDFDCFTDNHSKFNGVIKLPQLFRLYLDVGCKVCSPPALDTQFKTIDFLILLDLEAISEQTRALFFK